MNISEAQAASRFAFPTKQESGTVKHKVIVPGHDGRRYTVLLRPIVGGYSGECLLDTGALGTLPACLSAKGNNNGACYHIGAALLAVASQAGYKLAFCQNKAAAKRLRNLHNGIVLRYARHNGSKVEWAVVYKKEISNA